MSYESAKETAKKIRKALKAAFPGQKFSVRSKTYSMGSHVAVDYVDGPALADVKAVCKQYESAEFDGMIDLKTTPGYTDPETGEQCNGADWVNVQRDLSFETTKKLADEILSEHGIVCENPVTLHKERDLEWIEIKGITIDKNEPYPNDLRTAIYQAARERAF